MASFKKYYRLLFQTFGYPLTERMGTPSKTLIAAEKRLGVAIPAALRDYYAVAGRENRFNACHNRLFSPADWSFNQQHVVFMEENQSVVLWGVTARKQRTDDPAVFQGINDEKITWFRENRKCSVFLAVMLHYQAVCGGFRFAGSANAPHDSAYRFQDHGWKFYGEDNSLLAYCRTNQVVCLLPPGNAPHMQKWAILAGAKTKRDLQTIAADLGVTF